MIFRLRFLAAAWLLLLTCFIACDKDDDLGGDATGLSEDIVSASFYGQLTDTDGLALPNASIMIGAKSVTTDENGLWYIPEASVVGNRAFLNFEHPNFLKGSRTLIVQSGKSYKVSVELIRRTTYPIDAAQGGTVSLPSQSGPAKVIFPAGAFAQTDGSPFTGIVNVTAHYLDPSVPAIHQSMPGDLRGRTSSGETQMLTTFGMIVVEIRDQIGNTLVLANGQKATLEMPVPESLRNIAPSSIPLWHFDQTEATWVEEGQATLQNNRYIGEVSHFSWWNCDVGEDFARLCGKIEIKASQPQDKNRNPGSILINISSEKSGTRRGHTASDGTFCGIMPVNEKLQISLIDPCGNLIGTITVGPFSRNDTDIGTLVFSAPSLIQQTFSGRVFCGSTPISSGRVMSANLTNRPVFGPIQADGTFSLSFFGCSSADPRVFVDGLVDGVFRRRSFVLPIGQDLQVDTIELCDDLPPINETKLYIDGVLVHTTMQFGTGINDSIIQITQPTADPNTGTILARFTLSGGRNRPVGNYTMRPVSSIAWLMPNGEQLNFDLAGKELRVTQNEPFTARQFVCSIGPVSVPEKKGGLRTVQLEVKARY